MSSCLSACCLLVLALGAQADPYPGIGRAATPREIAAWDIDVRPDFKGLPKGRGTVAQGQLLWEAKCASCHGVFGESNEVFAPLVGGTTAADIRSGRVASLRDPAYPSRSMMMKLATLSTLWDYINRAMPWNAPKTLSTDEVYAVTAYLLHLSGVLEQDAELSDRNMPAVQQRLPNRAGMSLRHSLWPARPGAPDVQGSACMRNCRTEPRVASLLPAHARDAHGNLAEQNRLVGPQRGADTRGAAPAAPRINAAALAAQHGCTACHGLSDKLVGPGLRQIAARHAGRSDLQDYLLARIRQGGQGNWGAVSMPPQSLPEADAQALAQWLAQGAP